MLLCAHIDLFADEYVLTSTPPACIIGTLTKGWMIVAHVFGGVTWLEFFLVTLGCAPGKRSLKKGTWAIACTSLSTAMSACMMENAPSIILVLSRHLRARVKDLNELRVCFAAARIS